MSFCLSYEQLRSDLGEAFIFARRHKSNRLYVKEYEADLDENLDSLALRLWLRTYRPGPCCCFAVDCREVYAAQFEDRIVHCLYYMYTHVLFERTFIRDTYSCIKGRGIHDGVDRLKMHIRKESRNFTRRCYVLSLDIRGFFMHINRDLLCRTAVGSLEKMRYHRVKKHLKALWDDVLDFDFLIFLTELFCKFDALKDNIIKGSLKALSRIPKRKRLRYSKPGYGLPIGNLTSQLFSNIFLNLLDQFVKRVLRSRHYGHYVDDARIVSCSRSYLRWCLGMVRDFLKTLDMELQMTKVRIIDAYKGVDFCGAFLLPFRDYVLNGTKKKIAGKICAATRKFNNQGIGLGKFTNSLQSLLGTLGHYRTLHLYKSTGFTQCIRNSYS